ARCPARGARCPLPVASSIIPAQWASGARSRWSGGTGMTNLTHQRLMIPVQPVPKQTAEERLKNWGEADLGFDLNAAMVEAARCIQCPAAPCQEACPVHNDIPGAFSFLEIGDVLSASSVFRQTSNLPEMCGRLCPQEKLCEGACVVGFAIRVDGSY